MKKISVFGLGYVGTVTAACLADAGHRVVGVDVNPEKANALGSGHSPVIEPGLDNLIAAKCRDGRLSATTDTTSAVIESDISFICVGTPSLRNGRLDLSSIEHVCAEMGSALRTKKGFHLVVLRSTVMPGTSRSVVIPTIETFSKKKVGVDFAVCVNPEFTREGCAVSDFLNPGMIVLGADHADHLVSLKQLYGTVTGQILETSLHAAEMVKYVCNWFHALKVSFANEVGTLCRYLDVDEQEVMKIFLADKKLNVSAAYLKPGFAFGGSCLPKDLRALSYRAKQFDLNLPLVQAILPSNQAHLDRAVDAVLETRRKRIAVIGLSFKPGTDDLRESPSVQLIKRLLAEGCQLRVWDQDVSLGRLLGSNRRFIEEEIPHIGSLLSTDLEQVINSAEVIVINASNPELHSLLDAATPERTVIDLRSIIPPSLDARTVRRHEGSLFSEYSKQSGQDSLEAAASR